MFLYSWKSRFVATVFAIVVLPGRRPLSDVLYCRIKGRPHYSWSGSGTRREYPCMHDDVEFECFHTLTSIPVITFLKYSRRSK